MKAWMRKIGQALLGLVGWWGRVLLGVVIALIVLAPFAFIVHITHLRLIEIFASGFSCGIFLNYLCLSTACYKKNPIRTPVRLRNIGQGLSYLGKELIKELAKHYKFCIIAIILWLIAFHADINDTLLEGTWWQRVITSLVSLIGFVCGILLADAIRSAYYRHRTATLQTQQQ